MQPYLLDHTVWLDYLHDHLLPRVLAQVRKRRLVLRIWSVGCQTGDEATGLVLALYALLREEMAAWQIRIFATDTNPFAPARARERVDAELPEADQWGAELEGPPLKAPPDAIVWPRHCAARSFLPPMICWVSLPSRTST